MKEDNEFQEIGKKTPYQVPDGFFETLSEKTLQMARLRVQSHKKSMVLWRTVAVAASLTGIALAGYFALDMDTTGTKIMTVQEKRPDSIQAIRPIQEFAKPHMVAEMHRAKAAKNIEKGNNTEGVNEVIADLSDEELIQLAAMYKTDLFISESEQ